MTPSHLSVQGLRDTELLARMFARDNKAWAEFIRRFEPPIVRSLRRVLSRFTSVLASSDVDDAYAALLARLLGNDMQPLRAFCPERGVRLGTWLDRLARNAAYDFLRVRAQEQRLVRAALDNELSAAGPCDPEALLDAQQHWTGLLHELRNLTERDRSFVRLYYLERREPEEIARVMSISMSTVYSKRHKVSTRLRDALESRSPLRPSAATA